MTKMAVKQKWRLILAIVLTFAFANASATAQSLWERRQPQHAFLFEDIRARRVGDQLTLLINENTDVANQDQRSLSKQSDAAGALSLAHAAAGVFGNSSGSLSEDVSSESSRDFSGNASFSSARAFSDRVTVSVVDLLPNGDMIVSGQRQVSVEGDIRLLNVSGRVRYQDVAMDNSVQSRNVLDLNISYESHGAESHFVKQGWLGRIANGLWPF